MTYYEKLVRRTTSIMEQFPNSVVALDATNFKILAKGRNSAKVAKAVERATLDGQISVIVQKPHHEETWIL